MAWSCSHARHREAPEDTARAAQVALEQYGQHVASLFSTQAVTLDRVERLTELAVRSYTITFRTTRQEIMPAASPQADLQTEYWRHVHTLALWQATFCTAPLERLLVTHGIHVIFVHMITMQMDSHQVAVCFPRA